jgi:hypothetical protein
LADTIRKDDDVPGSTVDGSAAVSGVSYGHRTCPARNARSSESAASATEDPEAAADQAIQARGGDVREAVKALLIAVDFLEAQAAELRAAVSAGYARGRFELARDRKE